MPRSSGTRTPSVIPKPMRLRPAFPKFPADSSATPRLPLNKKRSLPTHSESTLPQPLIPLHFISFIRNVYRKPGEGPAHPCPKGLQLVTSPLLFLRSRTNIVYPERSLQGQSHSAHTTYFLIRGEPGVGVSPSGTAKLFSIARISRDESWLSLFGLSRATDHGSRNTAPLVPRYRCAATRKVPESRQLPSMAPWAGNISAPVGV